MTQQPKPRRWLVNLVFAAVVLLAAGGLWLAFGRPDSPAAYAKADFGMGVVEWLPLDTDYDYYYEVGGYIVHPKRTTIPNTADLPTTAHTEKRSPNGSKL